MKKKSLLFLLLIIVIITVLARVLFWEGMEGSDFSYHHTIVEQALQRDTLEFRNYMAYCGLGAMALHPLGYYLLPYMLAEVIGINATFFILSIIFGIITILLTYMLVAKVYSQKAGLFAAYLLGISLAHMTKTHPDVYRGEVITYPFLILSLFYAYRYLSEKDGWLKNAILAGFFSALPIFFWNGYIIELVVYIAAVTCTVIFKFFKNIDILNNVKHITISLFAQFCTLFLVYLIIPLYGKSNLFLLKYYPLFILGLLIFYAALLLSKKVNSLYPLAIFASISAGIAYFFKEHFLTLLNGFGSISSPENLVNELAPTTSTAMFFFFGGIYVLWFAAIVWAIIKVDHRSAFLLGWFFPLYYTITRANRYIYLFSVPMIVLVSAFLSNKKIVKKKFDIFVFLATILLLVQTVQIFYSAPVYFTPANTKYQNTLKAVNESTPETACIITVKNKGATIERFAQRNNYYNALGFDISREDEVYIFLLYGRSLNTTYNDLYLFLMDYDLRLINNIAGVTAIPNPDVSYNLEKVNPFLYYSPEFFTAFDINDTRAYRIYNKEYLPLRYSYFIDEELNYNPKGRGCFYSNSYHNLYMYLGDNLCDTIMYKAITGQEIPGMKKIYFKEGYVLYKIINYTDPSQGKLQQSPFTNLPERLTTVL